MSLHREAAGPVLLLGGGPGLATSGIVHLASYLRRHGIEAYARPVDDAMTREGLRRGVTTYLDATKPRIVGVSLKWFLHIYRSLLLARVIKDIDPTIRVVLGGDTASRDAEALSRFDCVDHVVRGDGEAPLLAIARGEVPPDQRIVNGGFEYLQDRDSVEVHYSHFDEIFLCARDRHMAPAFVVGGKGCSQSCGYCGGARTAQAENFGRKRAYLRPLDGVRHDVSLLETLGSHLIYDFSDHPMGQPRPYFEKLWDGIDLSRSGVLMFPWRVPPLDLIDLLAERHAHVTLNLDFGCFSERQRRDLIRRRLLKPLPDDDAYLEVMEHCRRYRHVRLRASAVAALPYLGREDLAAERRLVERLVDHPQLEFVLYDWVHSQPGAPLTEDPAAHGLISQVQGFDEFLAWNESHCPLGEYDPPLMYHRSDADTAFRSAPNGYPEGINQAVAESFVAVRAIGRGAEARFAPRMEGLESYWSMRTMRFARNECVREIAALSESEWLGPFAGAPASLPADDTLVLTCTGHMWSPGDGRSVLSEQTARQVLPEISPGRSVSDVLSVLNRERPCISVEQLGAAIAQMTREGVIQRVG